MLRSSPPLPHSVISPWLATNQSRPHFLLLNTLCTHLVSFLFLPVWSLESIYVALLKTSSKWHPDTESCNVHATLDHFEYTSLRSLYIPRMLVLLVNWYVYTCKYSTTYLHLSRRWHRVVLGAEASMTFLVRNPGILSSIVYTTLNTQVLELKRRGQIDHVYKLTILD